MNMATVTQILEDFNRRMPENVVREMENHIYENSALLETIAEHLPNKKMAELNQNIAYLVAFFNYVSPLIEPIAYCRIDEVFLIREGTKHRLQAQQENIMDLRLRDHEENQRLLGKISTIIEEMTSRQLRDKGDLLKRFNVILEEMNGHYR